MNNSLTTSSAKSILCVDDDADTCELLQYLLEDYEFVSRRNYVEGLQLIEKRPFDLYIFDNWLPDGSGMELCRKIRESGLDNPIIFVSGVTGQKDVREAMSRGANKYLTKPCEPDLLKKIIKDLLG